MPRSKAKRTVIVIGGAFAHQGVECARQFRAAGLHVVVADLRSAYLHCPEILAVAHEFRELDYRSAPCSESYLRAWIDRIGPLDFAFALCDGAVSLAAAMNDVLGNGCTPAKAIRLMQSRVDRRALLDHHGVTQPRSLPVPTVEVGGRLFETWAVGAHARVIVKPNAGNASHLVHVCDNAASVALAMAAITEAGKIPIMEDFVHGDEFSADGVMIAGRPRVLTTTQKIHADGSFVSVGQLAPAARGADLRAVRDLVEEATAVVGMTSGVFHIEYWKTDSGIVLGEIHNRPGDQLVWLMMQRVSGVEIFDAVARDVLGMFAQGGAPPLERLRSRARARAVACASIEPPSTGGHLDGWIGLDRAHLDPKCVAVRLRALPGDEIVGRPRHNRDLLGELVCEGSSPAKAWKRAQKWAKAVHAEVLAR